MRFRSKVSSLKDVRREYFEAPSRGRRVLIALGVGFQAIFLLAFSVVWTSIPGSFLFSYFFETHTTHGPVRIFVAFLGVFVLVGLWLFGNAVYRLVSLIRMIISAPPVGSVSAVMSDGNALGGEFSGATGTPNPFRFEKSEEKESAVATQKITPGRRVFICLFGSVFFCVGCFVSTLGVKNYLAENAAAETWVPAPCKIVSAKLESHSGSKGRTTYSPEVIYEFSVNGKTFRGDEVYFSGSVSTSDYERQMEKLAEYKKEDTCWYNPENPSENVLMRPDGEFSLRKITLALFGIPFWCFGLAAIALGIFAGRSRKKELARKPIGVLTCKDNPSEKIFIICFAALWNILVGVFGVLTFSDGVPPWGILAFLSIFVFAGIFMLSLAVSDALRMLLPRFTEWTSPAETLPRGGECVISWNAEKGNPERLNELELSLVRLIPTGTVVNGKPREKVAESLPICRTHSRAMIRSGSVRFSVPADLPDGAWAIRLSGKTAFPFPNLKADYKIG